MTKDNSAEMLREIGKAYFFNAENTNEKRNEGLQMIIKSRQCGDPEATYIVARLILDGIISIPGEDSTEHALMLMCDAANNGFVQARGYLNIYCDSRYKQTFDGLKDLHKQGPLVDFEGNPISLVRKGLLTPIDMILEYQNGINVLSINTNLQFSYCDEIADFDMFEEAVIEGLLMWQGDYEVFGGQKVRVEVNVTTEPRLFDNVVVMPMTSGMENSLRTIAGVMGTNRHKELIKNVLVSKRSFSMNGLQWSVKTRKFICIQSEKPEFDDYEDITNVAKHEFGHALGLGDLYQNEADNLHGVKKGTYVELDSYAITDRFYNLVMCDHHGPISNNDIEMVILAFMENKMQHFQPMNYGGKISSALGRGN